MTEIDIPWHFRPRPYQEEFLNAQQRFKIAVMHRRSGKSLTALNQQIIRTQRRPGIYYYFLPTYRSAKQVCWDSLVKENIPPEITDKINDSELAIYYKNGSIQRFVGCEDIDKHRGINPIDVVFDEFSEMNKEIWTAIIQPVLRENKGTATFVFTPKGTNHAWELIQSAKNNPAEWFVTIKTVADTDVFTREELEEIKRNTPEDLFNQEYNCEFLSGAGQAFRRIKENTHGLILEPTADHTYQIGVDLAKYQDFTVLTAIDLNTFEIAQQERFNQLDYNLQKAKIESFCLRWNRGKIWIDSTGVGEPVFDDLRSRGLPIEGFHFTEQSRTDLLRHLQLMLEQDKIKIPRQDELLDELRSFQYVLQGDKGKVRMQVPDGVHDDCVMSLALAVWKLDTKIGLPINLPNYQNTFFKTPYTY